MNTYLVKGHKPNIQEEIEFLIDAETMDEAVVKCIDMNIEPEYVKLLIRGDK